VASIPDPSLAAPSPWPWIGRRPRGAGGRASATGRLGERLRRLASRLGVRLAFAQALVLVSALGLAGYLSHVSGELVARRAIDQSVAGETASIRDEFVQKGADHLPHTIEKRSRLWHGFEYRLAGPDGVWRAGALPGPGPELGWSTLSVARGAAAGRFRTYSTRLPDGSVLTVAQDLSPQARQAAAMTRNLFWCGAFGVAVGVAVTYLVMGGAWRRIAAVARAAHEVSAGRLDVRVETRGAGLRDDIDELSSAFNTMLAEIDDLMGQVRQVSTAIAHDLRTPLTRVRQQLERLKGAASATPEVLEGVLRIDEDLGELLRGFDAMLRLAEIENAQGGAHALPIDLAEVAVRVVEAYRPDIEEAGRSLIVHIEPASIRGDPQLIAQALANLLDNALRHTPARTPITLGVERRPGGAVLYVADQGGGVPPEQRAAVLQRFRRLDPSRSGVGCGLGLAIVAAIAGRHGASLTLGDAGPGLRVELRFTIDGMRAVRA
jgi:signal transduction histidine kinase